MPFDASKEKDKHRQHALVLPRELRRQEEVLEAVHAQVSGREEEGSAAAEENDHDDELPRVTSLHLFTVHC